MNYPKIFLNIPADNIYVLLSVLSLNKLRRKIYNFKNIKGTTRTNHAPTLFVKTQGSVVLATSKSERTRREIKNISLFNTSRRDQDTAVLESGTAKESCWPFE